MGKASQAAFERGFDHGFSSGAQHERTLAEFHAWHDKPHIAYQPGRTWPDCATKVETADIDPVAWREMKLDPEKVKACGFASARSWVKTPQVQQSFGKGTMFEPVPAKTNAQIDAELNAELEAFGIGEPEPDVIVGLEEVAAGLLDGGDGEYGWLDTIYDGTSEYARALCELIGRFQLDVVGVGYDTHENAIDVAKRLRARLVKANTRRAA